MLSSLLTVSVLVAGIAAQSYSFPSGFDLSRVDEKDKDAWCRAQRNTCPMICPDGSASENNCNPSDLSFTCICGDGSIPDTAEYISTVPFFVCKANEAQCISNSGGSLKAERACKEEAKKECGTKDVNDDVDDKEDDEEEEEETTTSSSARATRTSTPTSETTAATTTAETGAASPTDDDNAASGKTYSMGLMAAALVGVLGFLV